MKAIAPQRVLMKHLRFYSVFVTKLSVSMHACMQQLAAVKAR